MTPNARSRLSASTRRARPAAASVMCTLLGAMPCTRRLLAVSRSTVLRAVTAAVQPIFYAITLAVQSIFYTVATVVRSML
jgi:hypothetical protein